MINETRKQNRVFLITPRYYRATRRRRPKTITAFQYVKAAPRRVRVRELKRYLPSHSDIKEYRRCDIGIILIR